MDGKHRLICSNMDTTRSSASGVAILTHRQWTSDIIQKICVNDRVMAVDLKIDKKIIRIMAVYLPHSGYEYNYFQETLTYIERLAMDAWDKRYTLIIAGDFNLSLDHGDRGRAMTELCIQFSMYIVNGQTPADDADQNYGGLIIYCIQNHYDRMIPLRIMIWIWDPIIGTFLHHWKLFDRQSLGHVVEHHLKDGSLH